MGSSMSDDSHLRILSICRTRKRILYVYLHIASWLTLLTLAHTLPLLFTAPPPLHTMCTVHSQQLLPSVHSPSPYYVHSSQPAGLLFTVLLLIKGYWPSIHRCPSSVCSQPFFPTTYSLAPASDSGLARARRRLPRRG